MPDTDLWSIFDELKQMGEDERLRVLRYQFEMSSYSNDRDELVDMRSRLDTAFRELTKLEIATQIGLTQPGPEIPTGTWDIAVELFRDSDALFRYTNANLFFGVRFLAGRLCPPEWLSGKDQTRDVQRHENQRTFALLPAPAIMWPGKAEPAFERFLDRTFGPEIKDALEFLDGGLVPESGAQRRNTSLEEPERFELWLRGLRPDASEQEAERFERLTTGITQWATACSEFYLSLAGLYRPDQGSEAHLRPPGGWVIDSPLAPRFGLADLYWLAAILRADVSSGAWINYGAHSWLHLLRIKAYLQNDSNLVQDLMKVEEVLRSVLGFTAELVQNAVEITSEAERRFFEPQLFHQLANENAGWRETFNEEMEQVCRQRQIRKFGNYQPDNFDRVPFRTEPLSEAKNWSEKLKSGHVPHHLIGLALSGGGIRSATFGLGVLQALQELDYLRSIDYLSTVSGGGFIGAWLVANVYRTRHWLGRLTSWDESIAHLRSYSSYLSPITGILSTDSWTMWAIYIRNTFLIQLTGLAWLLSLLLSALLAKDLFVQASSAKDLILTISWPGITTIIMALIVTGTLVVNFNDLRRESNFKKGWASGTVRWGAVFPSWVGSFFVAALIWGDATGGTSRAPVFATIDTYSCLFREAYKPWGFILLFVAAALFLSSLAILALPSWLKAVYALIFSALCTFAFYLQLCGIMLLFITWRPAVAQHNWHAFVLGPSLILSAFTITVVLLIGLTGSFSRDESREWWTRFGALLTVVAVLYLVVSTAAVFGPLWILSLSNYPHPAVSWGAFGTAVSAVWGGLFAGRSSKTDGNAAKPKARALEVVARLGGFVFIVTTVLGASTLLYLILQQFYSAKYNVLNCPWDLTSCYWRTLSGIGLIPVAAAFAIALFCAFVFSVFFDINVFGLSQFYANRLVRCYLGASRWGIGQRTPQAFIAFDRNDDLELLKLKNGDFRGPFPIINCSVNLGGSPDLSLHTRHSASFTLTPVRCGSDRRKIGYAPTESGANDYASRVTLGKAAAVSGAAVSPNMGYNTSPLVAFLLTMFNVRLGWWFANPGQKSWMSDRLGSTFYHLFQELIGTANENAAVVNVSDGGHFENLGIYELVRRRCRLIIAADAECDEFYAFGSLGNLVRICETDFGAKIDIDISSIRPRENGLSHSHAAVGKILYNNGTLGYLLYIKSSFTGNEDVGIAQYRSIHPSFPHETTADQFFSEDQFEAYRRLGHHAVRQSFCGTGVGEQPVQAVERLASLLSPEGPTTAAFLTHTKALDGIWERFRQSPGLRVLLNEITGIGTRPSGMPTSDEESCAVNELLQFMENVFLDLRLDDYWTHPDNRGWALLFYGWAKSETLRKVWEKTRTTYGIRFEYFCSARLGLKRDEMAARV